MNIIDVKIKNSFNIAKRGIALVTDLDYDDCFYNYSNGDVIFYNDKYYEVTGIEALLTRIDKIDDIRGKYTETRDLLAFLCKLHTSEVRNDKLNQIL